MLGWYRMSMVQRPLITSSITASLLFGTGDILSQQAVEDAGFKNHDYARTGRFALYGAAIFGPATSKWYPYLNSRYKELGPVAATLSRVASDQFIFAPLNLFVFLNTMAILEGTSPKDKLESTYRRVLTKNYMVWPIAQAVNFTFVPLDSRVLYVSAVSIGWNCYLSYANSRRIAQSQ